jgi:hypothetical protein
VSQEGRSQVGKLSKDQLCKLNQHPLQVVKEWWWGALARRIEAEIRQIVPDDRWMEVSFEGVIWKTVSDFRRVREAIDRLYHDVDRGRLTTEAFTRRLATLQRKYRLPSPDKMDLVHRRMWGRLLAAQQEFVPELYTRM